HEKLVVLGSFLAVGPHRSLKVRLLKSLGSLANLADPKSFKSLSIELNFRQLIIERSSLFARLFWERRVARPKIDVEALAARAYNPSQCPPKLKSRSNWRLHMSCSRTSSVTPNCSLPIRASNSRS